MADAQKNLRKSERRIKEMTYGSDEDRRTMSVCKPLLTNCKAKSSPTRSKLKRLRKLLPVIWPSTEMLMLSCLMLRNVLISMSNLWQRLRPVANQFLCKWMMPTGSQNGEILHAIDSQQFNIIL